MSLYRHSITNTLPSIKKPSGLRIEECDDVILLSGMGATTVDDVINRLANDHVAFVAYINNRPAAFGWMARGKATIGELNHEFILPERNRYLWNFRTMEAFRGLGIYPALLQFIIGFEAKRGEQFWIIHAPENNASLNGIIKAGFKYVGNLYTDVNGNAAIEASTATEPYREFLEYMEITLSAQTAASCWNCSSPYLKKRKAECCCSTAGVECIGNRQFSMAF
jgi:GNAT superfamily N-acetyltransferase